MLEYKTISETYAAAFDIQLNALSLEGWEIHYVLGTGVYYDTIRNYAITHYAAIMAREKTALGDPSID